MRTILLSVLVICLFVLSGYGQVTHFVLGTFATIQGAINGAASGDTVVVAPGTYFELIDFLGKTLVVKGAGIGQSIIDGQMLGSIVTIQSGEGQGTTLEGFTLKNGVGDVHPFVFGNAGLSSGGGVAVVGPVVSPAVFPYLKIVGCRFEACSANLGGGLSVFNASPVEVEGCEFVQCSAALGAGLYGGPGDLKVTSTLFQQNISTSAGGGITYAGFLQVDRCRFIQNSAGAFGIGGGVHHAGGVSSITSSEFYGNTGFLGAGIQLNAPGMVISDCIIAHNTGAKFGGGINMGIGFGNLDLTNCTIYGNGATQIGGGVHLDGGTLNLRNCIVRNNTGPSGIAVDWNGIQAAIVNVDHSNVDPARIDVDPYNVGPGGVVTAFQSINLPALFVDPANDDFHLTAASPCIDKGDRTLPNLATNDLDGDPRVVFVDVDMGADEAVFAALHPAAAGRVGINVSGPHAILTINGSTGGAARRVIAPFGSTATVEMAQPPNVAGPVNFAIFGLFDEPRLSFLTNVPLGIGNMMFAPCEMFPWLYPYLFTYTNNFGSGQCPEFVTSTPTPWVSPPGPPIGFPLTMAFQGVIEESPGIYVKTNMVIYEVK